MSNDNKKKNYENKFTIIPEKIDGRGATKLANATKLEATFTPGIARVALQSARDEVAQTPLWSAIRTRARWMAYPIFEKVVNRVFDCPRPKDEDKTEANVAEAIATEKYIRSKGFLDCCQGADAYGQLKATAEVFVALLSNPEKLLETEFHRNNPPPKEAKEHYEAVKAAENDAETAEANRNQDNPEINWTEIRKYLSPSSYPYLERIRESIKLQIGLSEVDGKICNGLQKDFCPMELLNVYWIEEGMMMQSLNAICLRFQNKRGPHFHDPLANFLLNPLRNLHALIWGYIETEYDRLTVARRAYEYDQEYGLRLTGRAVSDIQTVDHRSKFLSAFHNLLYVASRFYKEADNTTIRADAFPLLNALKELHLVLAQGADNQFGDLPWKARVEMLIQKWLLARPEIHEFLGGAPMVPYKEKWMAHADAINTLQGWTDVSVSHYRDLGVYGEQILLSVRWGDWSDDVSGAGDEMTPDIIAQAYNWAAYWRPEIQSYIHSYRAVTGVDLSSEVTDTRSAAARYVQPSFHLMRRLHQQRNGGNGLPRATARDGVVYPR